MNNIFITGGTGFLGSMLVNEILSSSDDNVHVLVRDKFAAFGKNRLITILEDLNEVERLDDAKKNRIHTYAGNITHKNLGLNKDALQDVICTIDTIYHCAAGTDLNSSIQKARTANVEGTKNVLELAELCKQKGKLKKVNHISTAYIVGNKKWIFGENDLDIGQGFNNTYEQTKFEAEKLAREYRIKDIDIDIFRPGIILGRYKNGKTTNFKMFYQPLHFFSRDLFDRIPAREHSKANMINVDIAARAIYLISAFSDKRNTTYHIVSPEVPSLDRVLTAASDFFGFRKPELVNPEEMDMSQEYTFVREKMIAPYVPYFNFLAEFDMKNTKKELTKQKFKFPEFDEENLTRLFEYCDKIGFIKRKKNRIYKSI